jgi:hypothetical protein
MVALEEVAVDNVLISNPTKILDVETVLGIDMSGIQNVLVIPLVFVVVEKE